jgi:hypothetical protein
MQKLSRLVALLGVDTALAPGNRFVNDLPGVGGELLENLGTREAATLAETWAKVKRRAAIRLLDQAEQRLADLFGWSKQLYQAPAPEILPVLDPPTPELGSAGVLVYVPDGGRRDVLLDSISVFLLGDNAETVELGLTDAATGAGLDLADPTTGELLSFPPIELTPGFNEIALGGLLTTPYAEAEFYVGLYGADGAPLALGLRPFALDRPADFGLTAAVQAVDSQVVVPNDQPLALLALGLRIECSLAKAIDRNPGDWAAAWLYLLGAEILAEKIRSPRTNYWSSANIAAAEVNRQELTSQYNAALNRIIKRLDVGALCADCQALGGVSYRTSLRA